MRLARCTLPCVALSLLVGCGLEYGYWDIARFTISPDALQDSEEVRVIYAYSTSGSNTAYYNHLIVVSQQTGDTVNVLTQVDHGNALAPDSVFHFIGESSFRYPVIIAAQHGGLIPDNAGVFERRPKVARNPTHEAIADNDHPAIIGAIVVLNVPKSPPNTEPRTTTVPAP